MAREVLEGALRVAVDPVVARHGLVETNEPAVLLGVIGCVTQSKGPRRDADHVSVGGEQPKNRGRGLFSVGDRTRLDARPPGPMGCARAFVEDDAPVLSDRLRKRPPCLAVAERVLAFGVDAPDAGRLLTDVDGIGWLEGHRGEAGKGKQGEHGRLQMGSGTTAAVFLRLPG